MDGETVEIIYPDLNMPILPSQRSYIKLVKKNCIVCGEEFQQKSHAQMFCSRECQEIKRKANNILKFGMIQPKECIICHKIFTPKTRDPKSSFCSEECRRKERQKLKLPKPLVREYFFERANFTCEECGAIKTHFECHHIVPIYKGGKDTVKNIKVLCDKCHRKAHGMR